MSDTSRHLAGGTKPLVRGYFALMKPRRSCSWLVFTALAACCWPRAELLCIRVRWTLRRSCSSLRGRGLFFGALNMWWDAGHRRDHAADPQAARSPSGPRPSRATEALAIGANAVGMSVCDLGLAANLAARRQRCSTISSFTLFLYSHVSSSARHRRTSLIRWGCGMRSRLLIGWNLFARQALFVEAWLIVPRLIFKCGHRRTSGSGAVMHPGRPKNGGLMTNAKSERQMLTVQDPRFARSLPPSAHSRLYYCFLLVSHFLAGSRTYRLTTIGWADLSGTTAGVFEPLFLIGRVPLSGSVTKDDSGKAVDFPRRAQSFFRPFPVGIFSCTSGGHILVRGDLRGYGHGRLVMGIRALTRKFHPSSQGATWAVGLLLAGFVVHGSWALTFC